MKQGQLFPEEAPRRSEEPPAEPPAQSSPVAAAKASPPPADDAARRRAVREFSRPLLLEAGAGTGKTATLVGRIVAWAIGPGWEEVAATGEHDDPERIAPVVLEGISAITFTEAAAAEMSTRVGKVLSRLEHAADDAGVPKGLVAADLPERKHWSPRASALRASLDRLTTCTIHAFCRRLIAAHPLELGLDPYFELDAQRTHVPLCVREVLEEFFQERWGAHDEEDLLELARRGYGPPQIEVALLELMDRGARAEDFRGQAMEPEVCARLTGELEVSLVELVEASAPFAKVPKNQKTHLLLAALTDAAALFATEKEQPTMPPRERFESWHVRLGTLFDAGTRDKLKQWRKGRFTKNEAKHIEGAEEGVSRSAQRFEAALDPLLELDPEHAERARRLVRDLLSRVEARLRARGLTTFNDLLRDAQRLLSDFPEVASAERRRIRQLLVDEFQDTDAGQCDIVRQLALRGPADERPALFCVGDPKQSIYAWRSADLFAYDTFARELREAGGEVLALTVNFRSRPGILAEVERAVRPVMERIEGVQPAFVGLQPHRADAEDGVPPVEFWPSWPQDEDGAFVTSSWSRMQAGYEVEARAIAADVARLAARGTPFKEMALLFRAATGVETYLRALRELGIPYVVQSDRSYYRRREVVDAGALVRCLLDPADQLALVTLLRSPWVGVPDAALFALWSAGFPDAAARLTHEAEGLLERVDETLEAARAALPAVPHGEDLGDWPASARFAMRAVARLRSSFEREPVDRWITDVRRHFLPDAVESARFLAAFRRGNLERFFRELENALELRGDVHAVLASLRTNLGREVESEVTRPSDSELDAVRVLTIHGSKGLEFEHVYLAQGHRLPPGDMGGDVTFERRGEAKGTAAWSVLGAKNPAAFDAKVRGAIAEAAERVRLLYVALTRAKERLVVLGAFSLEPRRETWRLARRFTELLEHREGLEKALAELSLEAPAHEARDAFGCRFRSALGVGELDAATPVVEGKEDGPRVARPTVEEAIRQAAELHRRRAEARAHQTRPWSTSASRADHEEPPADVAARGTAEPSGLSRRAAKAVGEAVHRALELCDLDAERDAELAKRRESLEAALREVLDDDELPRAVERARALLDGMHANGLWDRFFELGEHVVARELDVLLPPALEDTGPESPTGYVSGQIDLLYRCPETGELVVADYKSDRVEGEAALEERAHAYVSQGRAYVRALREALQLDAAPRFELWFLHAGRVVDVETGA